MSEKKRINKIIDAVERRLQSEVSALLGVDFSIISGERKSVNKEDAFDKLQGKQICALMDITGEITGKGCLLIGIKDAIRLGGTLIMLPSGEMEEVIGREEYSEEVEDSYGEIANIIAGSFTKDFEELYPKSCRFVRKEQEVLVPVKVDVDSDRPVANQIYYQVASSMVLDGRQMGDLVMLLPAATFDLLEQENKAVSVDDVSEEAANQAVSNQKAQEDEAEPGINDKKTGEGDKKPEQPVKTPVEPKFDVAKHKKKIDRLLSECQKRMQAEVGTLLGVDVVLSDPENQLLNKEDFFSDHVVGRQVLADMEVVGEKQGKSYLAVSVRDAIHLGGILIMLPPSELENVVKAEEFGEDARDAYGEIANIISGVYTAVFEEQYTSKLRFVRKDLRDIIPVKVDVTSDDPIPDVIYYTNSVSVAVDGKPLGRMHMLFPADLLRLDVPQEKDQQETVAETGQSATRATDSAPAAQEQSSVAGTEAPSTGSGETGATDAGQPQQSAQPDVQKHKKRVDKILAACKERMADEVSALLGADIKLKNLENVLVNKEEFFFDEVSGKQVIANMDVVGEIEGKSYLSIGLRDAIRIGGALIMLPTAELEAVVGKEEFSDDTQDAYGEIANIIAGVYTAVFEEQYTKQIRFVKTDLQQVAPMKVEISADTPFPDQDYYLSRMDMSLGELQLGKINILFPAQLLQLGGLRPGNEATEQGAEKAQSSVAQVPGEQKKSETGNKQSVDGNNLNTLDILVVGDDEAEAAKIADVLGRSGYAVKKLSFKDNLHNYIPGNLKAIYLVMRDVNEQAFGVAIKVSSACSLPLIAAGPDWTRTKVIKAVKYGVRDILLTPALEEDIVENVNNNLLELAA